ncbi:uncharacterized protein [Euphorbia lathyris]|uniref:uncharacterized protein isoform X3 n=1 Tax=Euphorbia lathyris TaxID=212925 RepID=UPI003313A16F
MLKISPSLLRIGSLGNFFEPLEDWQPDVIDYSSRFITDTVFSSCEDAVTWAKQRENRCIAIILIIEVFHSWCSVWSSAAAASSSSGTMGRKGKAKVVVENEAESEVEFDESL